MPLEKDGSGEAYRAKQTLKQALQSHLGLLHAFLPMQGWLVGTRSQGAFQALAVHGAWRDPVRLDSVSGLMQGQWDLLPQHSGFQGRALDGADRAHTHDLLDGPKSDWALRRPLRDTNGHVQAWLLGMATKAAIRAMTGAGFPQRSVQQVVTAMTLTLSLHAQFSRTHHSLAELQHNVFIDPLTGVLNRAGWTNRVEHLEKLVSRNQKDVAIIMLDLDLLKGVNDRFGHSAGDDLLRLTATTIGSALRAGDVVGRLGGDEFGVAIKGVDQDLAALLVKRLRYALLKVNVPVSMGVALKSEAGNIAQALVLADARMYDDKRSKRLGDACDNAAARDHFYIPSTRMAEPPVTAQ